MVFVALAVIGSAASPPAGPSDAVAFASMDAALLGINVLLLLAPVAVGLFLLSGLHWMRDLDPRLLARLTWGGPTLRLSPVGVAAALGLVAAATAIALSLFSLIAPVAGLFDGDALWAFLVFLGWFLLCASGAALEVLATPAEARGVRVAVLASFLCACLVAGGQLVATAVDAPRLLADPEAVAAPVVLWADLPGAFGGAVAIAVLAWVAFRVQRRMAPAPSRVEPDAPARTA